MSTKNALFKNLKFTENTQTYDAFKEAQEKILYCDIRVDSFISNRYLLIFGKEIGDPEAFECYTYDKDLDSFSHEDDFYDYLIKFCKPCSDKDILLKFADKIGCKLVKVDNINDLPEMSLADFENTYLKKKVEEAVSKDTQAILNHIDRELHTTTVDLEVVKDRVKDLKATLTEAYVLKDKKKGDYLKGVENNHLVHTDDPKEAMSWPTRDNAESNCVRYGDWQWEVEKLAESKMKESSSISFPSDLTEEQKEGLAKDYVKKYYNHEFDLETLHNYLKVLFGSYKKAVNWLSLNDKNKIKESSDSILPDEAYELGDDVGNMVSDFEASQREPEEYSEVKVDLPEGLKLPFDIKDYNNPKYGKVFYKGKHVGDLVHTDDFKVGGPKKIVFEYFRPVAKEILDFIGDMLMIHTVDISKIYHPVRESKPGMENLTKAGNALMAAEDNLMDVRDRQIDAYFDTKNIKARNYIQVAGNALADAEEDLTIARNAEVDAMEAIKYDESKLKEDHLGNRHPVPENFEIIELRTFKKAIKKYNLTAEDIEDLKKDLKVKLPESSYGSGVYKFRWCPKRLNLGTSESRVIYIEIIKESKVYLVDMFLKKEKADLSDKELKDCKALSNELRNI